MFLRTARIREQHALVLILGHLLLLLSWRSGAVRVPPGDDSLIDATLPVSPGRNTKNVDSVNVTIPDSPDGHLVTSLPLLDPSSFTTQHWAGHLPASPDTDKYFFYWLFAPDLTGSSKTMDEVPLLIWLNGGPGCSSMTGLLIENGPFKFVANKTTKEYKLIPDNYSWHKLPAYTLYIDQPVGTGLSFTTSRKYCSNDAELNEDFYYFIQQFLRFHKDKFVSTGSNGIETMNRSFYISGESHAGHYNSIYANYILKQNKNLKEGDIHIPLKGAAIGNGWVDPYYQYAGAETAFGHGLIGMAEVAAFDEKLLKCQSYIDREKYNVGLCFALIDDIGSMSHGENSQVSANKYDIRLVEKRGHSRTFPHGRDVVEKYLGDRPLNEPAEGTMPDGIMTSVLEALHASAATAAGQRYVECSSAPSHALSHLDGKGVVSDIVEVLEHPDEVELFFFNGMMDLVCNHASNEKSLDMLPWEYNTQWRMAERYAWIADSEPEGQVSGYMREYNNLKFLKLLNAGHMVPIDIPGIAFEMMRNFLDGRSFKASQQELERSATTRTCAKCDECPDTSGASGSDNVEGGEGNSAPSSILISGLVVGLVCCIVVFLCRQQTSSSPLAVSGDDVELRNSSYSDQVQ